MEKVLMRIEKGGLGGYKLNKVALRITSYNCYFQISLHHITFLNENNKKIKKYYHLPSKIRDKNNGLKKSLQSRILTIHKNKI